MGKHLHRPSSLKQCNKPFKGKKCSRKKKKDGGNESIKASECSHKCQSKAERVLKFKQQRQNKTEKAREFSRYGIPSVESLPPKIVMILPLAANIDALRFKNEILRLAGGTCDDRENKPVTFLLPPWCKSTSKQERHSSRLTLIDVNPFKYFDDSDMFHLSEDSKTKYWRSELLYYVLDIAKAANIIIVLMQDNNCTFKKSPFDPFGYELMSALRLQGMPTVVGCLANNSEITNLSCEKKKEKLIHRFFKSEFGTERKFAVAKTDEQKKNFLRLVCNTTTKEFPWRSHTRGYMMTEFAELSSCHASTKQVTFWVEGFVQGVGFSVRHPIHITGVGDAILESITDISTLKLDDKKIDEGHVLETLTREILKELEEEYQPLRRFDSLAGEQTWPTIQELNDTKLYDDSCLPEDMEFLSEKNLKLHDEETCDDDVSMISDNSNEFEIDNKKDEQENDNDDLFSFHDEAPNENFLVTKKRETFALEERCREDMEFPDEIDIDPAESAQERLKLYRGLKSFRSSFWDPYEELPKEYSRIHQFDYFNASVRYGKKVYKNNCLLGENKTSITGKYVRLQIRLSEENVSEAFKVQRIKEHFKSFKTSQCPFIISSLLPYERKVCICNAVLHRTADFCDPLPSKQEVEIQCGLRRFIIQPIFAQQGSRSTSCLAPQKGEKLKYERFFHPDATVFASFYGLTTYPGAPVMIFAPPVKAQTKEQITISNPNLAPYCSIAAWGSMVAPDALRVIVKRIVLAGYPFRVHKRKAVIRYMFFNPSDVRWFKPVELCTKQGLRGHIKEPLGTHGYMKCTFSEPIDQSDTVCMYSYKRVFPKWFPLSWGQIGEYPFNAE